MTRRDAVLSGLAIMVLTFLGFANPLWQIPLTALALPGGLYCIGVASPSRKTAFVRGLLAGGLAYAACLYWVAVPVHDYGFMPWVLAAPCPVLLGLVMGCYAGAYTVLARIAGRRLRPPWSALAAGIFWGALEGLRGVLFTGFTWLALPSAFVPWPDMLQTASLVGSDGLAAILAFLAVLPWAGFFAKGLRTRARLGWLAAGIAGMIILGFIGSVGPLFLPPETGTARVALVQGNIDQSLKWNPAFQRGTVDRYVRLTTHAVTDSPMDINLVIWPETAMPFYFQENSVLSLRVRQLAEDLGTALLLGSPGYKRDQDGLQYFNRAFLLDSHGETAGYYDKEHLVPFGEYIPFGKYLPFLTKLVQGVGDFTSGTHSGPLVVPANGNTPRLKLGVLTCYETIFPELARRRAQKGSSVLVNISNDAWFGRTSAPMQHLQLSALRAVEEGRTLLRATNTGISAIVEPGGRLRTTTPLFEEATVEAEVSLHEGLTPYGRFGGLILPILIGIGMLIMFYAIRRQPDA
ncbi:apolipoprotein N-acyltransferase [Oceanidesulfovibrio marinus]|uniref:Apolipoprotein N-acyltransferase n=1 Tax=Oceanidesulfovibrio marinus TaxID=370038 RepID=A0A6P1ZC60_9BACT|nr:apolipoprotein N-acyltransferase [Oceanidesulfovibrio marinus]TVM30437.1 apolipoprotein N-acyltransferase [Oceanidesulfovibrio marinus]